jgi:polysaccharide export outer membrane protein
MAPLPAPAKSEKVAQPSPPTVFPSPPKEEAQPRELPPSPATRIEIAVSAPAPLAADAPSMRGSVPSPEPPPAVPSTPPASDFLQSKEERSLATKFYRIGPEDVLKVSVWDNPVLGIDNVTVRPDGKISLPLIKDIQAEGFTPMEISDVITRNLEEYIKDPHVTVIVTQTFSKKIFLVGNVLRPGSYPLRKDMTLLQALSLAGGFTTFASPRDMKLIRGSGTKQESRKINYYKMIEDIEFDNYKLKPGDTIVIP